MYRYGHLGISLILDAPLSAYLFVAGYHDTLIVSILVVLFAATLPDIDQKLPFIKHRGFTHSVWFAAIFGSLIAFLYLKVPYLYGPFPPAITGFLIGFIAISFHLVGDWLNPMGIRPFAPLWRHHFSARIMYARDDPKPLLKIGRNKLLFGLGIIVWFVVILQVSGLVNLVSLFGHVISRLIGTAHGPAGYI